MYPTNCYPGGTSINFNPLYSSPSVPTAVPMQSQQSPSYARPMLIGKVVNKIEDVTPNDIPMDGSYGIFPLKDRSKIFLKKWNSDGTISTETFVKEETDVVEEPESDPIDEKLTTIQFDIQQLKEAFNKIEKSFKPKAPVKGKEASNE